MQKQLRNAQNMQTQYYNKKIKSQYYKIKNKIIFSIENFKITCSKKKLFYKYTKLFEIVDIIETQIYRLQFSD